MKCRKETKNSVADPYVLDEADPDFAEAKSSSKSHESITFLCTVYNVPHLVKNNDSTVQ